MIGSIARPLTSSSLISNKWLAVGPASSFAANQHLSLMLKNCASNYSAHSRRQIPSLRRPFAHSGSPLSRQPGGGRVNHRNVRLFSTTNRWLLQEKDHSKKGQREEHNNGEGTRTLLISRPSKHVAALELHRPEAKNAFGLDTAGELIAALRSLEADPSVRCVLLGASGDDFTSGVDLKSFMGVYARLQETEDVAHRAKLLRSTVELFQAPFKELYAFPKPLIAVQHGLCLGLGLELAACCDIRYCTRDIRLAIREVVIGIAADVGSLQLLPRLVTNQSLLHELIYTGRYLSAAEVAALAFYSESYFESKQLAWDRAHATAKLIASRSPVAVQGSKRNLTFSRDKPFLVGLDYNAIWNASMMQGADVTKAIETIFSKSQSDPHFDDF